MFFCFSVTFSGIRIAREKIDSGVEPQFRLSFLIRFARPAADAARGKTVENYYN